jgi:hypothetical protein
LLVLAVYTVWVQFPKLKNPQLVESIYKDATARHEAVQASAGNPEENGYLNPTFLPYWGRRGIELDPAAQSVRDLEAWKVYSSEYQGVAIDHRQLQADGDGNYLKALKQMKLLAPELIKATGKPIFSPPNSTLDFGNAIPNYIALRASAQLMSGLAAAYVAEGDLPKAGECLLTAARLGRKLHGQGPLISHMIGVAVQSIGSNGFLALVDINDDVSAEQWKELAQALLDEVPPEDMLAKAIECEMTGARNTLEMHRQGTQSLDELRGLDLLPGLLSREERIYVNSMTDCLSQIRSGGNLTMPSYYANPTTYDWISGKTSFMADRLVPNYTRASQIVDINRQKYQALATAYGVAAYRAQKGEFPNELSQLSTVGIPLTDDPEFLNRVEWKMTPDAATLKVRIQSPSSTINWQPENFWEHPWLQCDDEFATFLFEPTE